jgi:hypothetical protein
MFYSYTMSEIITSLWEVLVPVKANSGEDFTVQHHQQWDDRVRAITGGLTIMRTAKGQWVAEDGVLFSEKVIPVRVACDELQAREVMQLTMAHYGQLAVMAYEVSSRAIIITAE